MRFVLSLCEHKWLRKLLVQLPIRTRPFYSISMNFLQEAIIRNSLCILGLLVAVTTIFAAGVFLVREWMKRVKPHQTGVYTEMEAFGDENIQNPPRNDVASTLSTVTNLQAYTYHWDEDNHIVPKRPGIPITTRKSSSTRKPITTNGSRNKLVREFQQSDWPVNLNLSAKGTPDRVKRSPHYLDMISPPGSPLMFRKRYPIEELMDLRPLPKSEPHTVPVQLSSLLNYKSQLPLLNSISSPQLELNIAECTLLLRLVDTASKNIGLFKILHLGVSKQIYSNPVHFVESYCHGLVLSVRNTLMNAQAPDLQDLLVNVASCFCWEHWYLLSSLQKLKTMVNDKQPPGAEALHRTYHGYFLPRKVEPYKLSRPSIFGLLADLCNNSLSSRPKADSTRRLAALFLGSAADTECLEYKVLVPHLADAVSRSCKASTKGFFYVVLLEMVKPHIHCCLAAQDVYSHDSVLFALIKYGLEEPQNSVRERAKQLYREIGQRHTELWTTLNAFLKANGEGPNVAPGAWGPFQ